VSSNSDIVAFLGETIESLSGYRLVVERVIEGGATIVVELDETVDDGTARLRTEEAIVFDIAADTIARVGGLLAHASGACDIYPRRRSVYSGNVPKPFAVGTGPTYWHDNSSRPSNATSAANGSVT